jgi:hypothetical protein
MFTISSIILATFVTVGTASLTRPHTFTAGLLVASRKQSSYHNQDEVLNESLQHVSAATLYLWFCAVRSICGGKTRLDAVIGPGCKLGKTAAMVTMMSWFVLAILLALPENVTLFSQRRCYGTASWALLGPAISFFPIMWMAIKVVTKRSVLNVHRNEPTASWFFRPVILTLHCLYKLLSTRLAPRHDGFILDDMVGPVGRWFNMARGRCRLAVGEAGYHHVHHNSAIPLVNLCGSQRASRPRGYGRKTATC